MSLTFEAVLKQAKAFPGEERRKQVEAFKKPSGHNRRIKKWDDDPAIKASRSWVDSIEASTDPEIRASIESAERIRNWNDRGLKL